MSVNDHKGPYERYARALRAQLGVDALGVLILDGPAQAWAHSAPKGSEPITLRLMAKALRAVAGLLDAEADQMERERPQ